MHILWGCIMAVIGVLMFICGTRKNEFVIYRLLVARSKILWGEKVHRFYQFAGILVAIFGVLLALGYIPMKQKNTEPEHRAYRANAR